MAATFYEILHEELRRRPARKPLDLAQDQRGEEFFRLLPIFLERAGLQLRRRVDKATVRRFRAFLREVCRPMPSVTDSELVRALEQAEVAERNK